MAVTMLDIARGLDVSVVTVSKVLRNQGKISAAVRKRALNRAKEKVAAAADIDRAKTCSAGIDAKFLAHRTVFVSA